MNPSFVQNKNRKIQLGDFFAIQLNPHSRCAPIADGECSPDFPRVGPAVTGLSPRHFGCWHWFCSSPVCRICIPLFLFSLNVVKFPHPTLKSMKESVCLEAHTSLATISY